MAKKRKKRVSKKVNHSKPPEVTPEETLTESPPGEADVSSSIGIDELVYTSFPAVDEPRPCDQYQIIHLFSYGKYLYNVGEPVPNVNQKELDKLFEAGRIAKLVDGRVVRHVKEIHYSDSRINMISEQDISVIKAFIVNKRVPLDDIRKLLTYCVQGGREPYILEIIGTEINEREPLPDEPF